MISAVRKFACLGLIAACSVSIACGGQGRGNGPFSKQRQSAQSQGLPTGPRA